MGQVRAGGPDWLGQVRAGGLVPTAMRTVRAEAVAGPCGEWGRRRWRRPRRRRRRR